MIRRSAEIPLFAPWRAVDLIDELAWPHALTVVRYEPVLRSNLGAGVLDLLFENAQASVVLGGVRLDPDHLILRTRSPIIWPLRLATTIAEPRLEALEAHIVPWLRSIARARPMCNEAIRTFVPSPRFERARELGLLGAAPLERSLVSLAPYVYARRFARGARIAVEARDHGVAAAMLGEIAARIDTRGERDETARFCSAWYGAQSPSACAGRYDVALVDDRAGIDAAVTISLSHRTLAETAVRVEVPAPAPLDVLFTFDPADAPAAATFMIAAREPALRESAQRVVSARTSSSSGRIVLALAADALAQQGAEIEDLTALQHELEAEGLSVVMSGNPDDPSLAQADLLHVAGAPHDPHMSAFAERARSAGIPYLFDLAPRAQPSRYRENMLLVLRRSVVDDADLGRLLPAYLQGALSGTLPPEPTSQEFERLATAFAGYAADATGVFAPEADLADVRAGLPPGVWSRVAARAPLAPCEPAATPIGHLTPAQPFAFVHAVIGARSHALFCALALADVPLVIAGTAYDVDYLAALRLTAPEAVILVDPHPGVVAALYRRAAVWVDAAPRPPSASRLARAVAAGALPVVARESPLARIAGEAAPTFSIQSPSECYAVVTRALSDPRRDERLTHLRSAFEPSCARERVVAAIMAAYARAATPV